VSLEAHTGTASEMVLRCRPDSEGGEEICYPLVLVSGLRRLHVDGEAAPGLELRMAAQKPLLLQLLAVPSGRGEQGSGQACTSWARLQVLHAFLAGIFESNNKALAAEVRDGSVHSTPQAFLQVCPLEWPHEGGRRASLEHLALVLRGVTTMKAKEVPQRARFAGPACPVCLDTWEEMPPERPAVVLACGHGFCERCLAITVEQEQQQKSCPTCRHSLKPPRQAQVANKRPQVPPEAAMLT